MKQGGLAEALRAGEHVLSAWSSLAVPIVSEIVGRSGYDAVCLDMQHGEHDVASVRACLASLTLGGAHRIVRVPVGDMANVSRALDLGAELVIAPMINSAEAARSLVDAAKYPPVGSRSWGPLRAATLNGEEPGAYLEAANHKTVVLAMIETPEAIAALDEILAVPGLDGIFVGPADLSLTLSGGKGLDPTGPGTLETAASLASRAKAAGKIAGLFCMTPEMVKQGRAMGFALTAYGIDSILIGNAAQAAVQACRQD